MLKYHPTIHFVSSQWLPSNWLGLLIDQMPFIFLAIWWKFTRQNGHKNQRWTNFNLVQIFKLTVCLQNSVYYLSIVIVQRYKWLYLSMRCFFSFILHGDLDNILFRDENYPNREITEFSHFYKDLMLILLHFITFCSLSSIFNL